MKIFEGSMGDDASIFVMQNKDKIRYAIKYTESPVGIFEVYFHVLKVKDIFYDSQGRPIIHVQDINEDSELIVKQLQQGSKLSPGMSIIGIGGVVTYDLFTDEERTNRKMERDFKELRLPKGYIINDDRTGNLPLTHFTTMNRLVQDEVTCNWKFKELDTENNYTPRLYWVKK